MRYNIIISFANIDKENYERFSEEMSVTRVPCIGERVCTYKFGSNLVKDVQSIFMDEKEVYAITI